MVQTRTENELNIVRLFFQTIANRSDTVFPLVARYCNTLRFNRIKLLFFAIMDFCFDEKLPRNYVTKFVLLCK